MTGKPREELGQLEGRAYLNSAPMGFGIGDATSDRAKVEWVIHAPVNTKIALVARHARAGVARGEVTLLCPGFHNNRLANPGVPVSQARSKLLY